MYEIFEDAEIRDHCIQYELRRRGELFCYMIYSDPRDYMHNYYKALFKNYQWTDEVNDYCDGRLTREEVIAITAQKEKEFYDLS